MEHIRKDYAKNCDFWSRINEKSNQKTNNFEGNVCFLEVIWTFRSSNRHFPISTQWIQIYWAGKFRLCCKKKSTVHRHQPIARLYFYLACWSLTKPTYININPVTHSLLCSTEKSENTIKASQQYSTLNCQMQWIWIHSIMCTQPESQTHRPRIHTIRTRIQSIQTIQCTSTIYRY